MTRIIAGEHRGRRLLVPQGGATRPTADRAREGLFSSLQSLVDLEGAQVLDLYAGSGALGLEAVSRGAAAATFVERDPAAAAVIRKNVEALGVTAEVVEQDVERFLAGRPRTYQLVLVDPPYDLEVSSLLDLLPQWTAPDGVVVLERATRGPEPAPPQGMSLDRGRRYGEATLWYFSRP